MDVITIKTEAFSRLLEDLTVNLRTKNVETKKLTKDSLKKSSLSDQWLDNEKVCLVLRVTKRPLQNYRKKLLLPYSQIGRKILYKETDVIKLLEKSYMDPDDT